MPSQGALILRLLLAGALAGLLGVERELTEQPAGFRTHILVGLGSALFAIISAYGFQAIAGLDPGGHLQADPTRIASQIVVGIGFLGGGAILKYGASVRGLTTAASLWVTAAIGTAVGIGALVLGTVTALITLVALVGLRPLRGLLRRYAAGREEFVVEATREVDVQHLIGTVRDSGAALHELRVSGEGDETSVRIMVQLPHGLRPDELAAELAVVEHVRGVDWLR